MFIITHLLKLCHSIPTIDTIYMNQGIAKCNLSESTLVLLIAWRFLFVGFAPRKLFFRGGSPSFVNLKMDKTVR